MRIAVIGGGFSGTLVSAHLLRAGAQVTLVERGPRLGRGIAYGTNDPRHVLNVPAGKISAFADDPGHFLNWLRSQGHTYEADAFVPRTLFGQYTEGILCNAEAHSPDSSESDGTPGRLTIIQDEAVDLNLVGDEIELLLESGATVRCEKAVLAVGNWRPGDPSVPDTSFYQTELYVRDPRNEQELTKALERTQKDDNLLIVGAGLTMIDLVVTLRGRGHRGIVHVLSRRGLLPQRHQKADPYTWDAGALEGGLRTLVKTVRREAKAAMARGGDWRSVIDGLRPHTQRLWSGLSAREKQAFLRHLQALWDIHRHRIAADVHDHLFNMFRSGRLVLHAGRLLRFERAGDQAITTYRSRNPIPPHAAPSQEHLATITARFVLNCTGPETNYRRVRSPIIGNLLERGLIESDPLRLGLLATPSGALLDAQGHVSSRLFSLGPPLKGMLWETTAVPEIRVQAAELARQLLT